MSPSQPQPPVRTLVTGASGFTGRYLVEKLLGRGHTVIETVGARDAQETPTRLRLDITSPDACRRVIELARPDYIVHLAAISFVGHNDPLDFYRVNVIGTLNLLDAAVACGARKMIFASSAATYGEGITMPANESSPQIPISPYGITKMVAEHYLRFYQSEHGLEYTVLRYGNVYGPRQDPSGEAGVIAIFIGKFLAGEGIRIDWDGEQTRDYVFVRDVVNANIAALTRGTNDIFVIGTGKKTSVNQIYRSLVEVSGREAPITRAPRRAGDAREIYFKPAKAAAELGWRAEVDLVTGMRETYAYFRDRVTVGA